MARFSEQLQPGRLPTLGQVEGALADPAANSQVPQKQETNQSW